MQWADEHISKDVCRLNFWGGGGYLPCLHTRCVCHCAMFLGLKFHFKAVFLGLKFANMNFPFFGGKNFKQLPFSLGSIM